MSTEKIQSKYADVLNGLWQMQQSFAYAARKPFLIEAEKAIVAKLWKQLGVTQYTGKSIYEYVADLQRHLAEARAALGRGIKTMESSYAQHQYADELETLNFMKQALTTPEPPRGGAHES